MEIGGDQRRFKSIVKTVRADRIKTVDLKDHEALVKAFECDEKYQV